MSQKTSKFEYLAANMAPIQGQEIVFKKDKATLHVISKRSEETKQNIVTKQVSLLLLFSFMTEQH